MDTIPAATTGDKLRWCPGCDQQVPEAEMAYPGGYTPGPCLSCWKAMRPFERILLDLLATPGFESEDRMGLGVGFELNELLNLGQKLFRVTHGHDADRPCPKCDPDGYRLAQELKAKAAARKKANPQPEG